MLMFLGYTLSLLQCNYSYIKGHCTLSPKCSYDLTLCPKLSSVLIVQVFHILILIYFAIKFSHFTNMEVKIF